LADGIAPAGASGGLPPIKPLAIKERQSVLFVEKGEIDVIDGAFVLVDATGVRTQIPVGGIAALMLEPGTRLSHRAAALAARVGTLLVWVGEAGVRLYASGQPGGARADRLLYQAKLALDDELRLKVVRQMYALRFGEDAPQRRSVEQLRGIEGARVRRTYQLLARQYGVDWKAQPLPECSHRLPVRRHRSGGAGRRICAGRGLHPHRQTAVLRVRHRRPLQIRHRGAGGLPDCRQQPGRAGRAGRAFGLP
jgi:hypothetical protein